MKLITVTDMQALIRRVGLEPFLALAVDAIEDYLRRWPELQLSPRQLPFRRYRTDALRR